MGRVLVMRPQTAVLGLALLTALAGCVPLSAPVSAPGPDAARPMRDAARTRMAEAAWSADEATQAEVHRLRAVLEQSVRKEKRAGKIADIAWIDLAARALSDAGYQIVQPQLIVVVDRNPRVQELAVVLAQAGPRPWQVIGGSKVSTGQADRRGYFITPTGVFPHTPDIIDFRAEGTFNENHIRGLGIKGMRVWDFGWQVAQKGWLPAGEFGEMRLLLHATDPDVLEQRLGRPASQGCVRIPAGMNRFLDLQGVLDAAYERAAGEDPRIAAVLLPERTPTWLAGQVMVVVDSSEPSNLPAALPRARIAVADQGPVACDQ